MENGNMKGHGIGMFTQKGIQTEIDFTEDVTERLKLSLWEQYEHDRDGYTENKTAFVKEYTQKAKEEFEDRYTQ